MTIRGHHKILLAVAGLTLLMTSALMLRRREPPPPGPVPAPSALSASTAPLTSSAAPPIVRRPDYKDVFVFGMKLGSDPCGRYFFEESSHKLFQVSGDVALDISHTKNFLFNIGDVPRAHLGPYNDLCAASLLIREHGLLVRAHADRVNGGRPHYSPADGASTRFSRYVAPDQAVVRALFRPGRSLFWIDGRGERCEELAILPLSARHDPIVERDDGSGDLRVFTSQAVPQGTTWGMLALAGRSAGSPRPSTLPFLLVTDATQPARLLVGTRQKAEGGPYYKCRCERLFRVMKVDGEELHLLPRIFPEDPTHFEIGRIELPTRELAIESYDPGETERWFTSRDRCERERIAALERVRADGRVATLQGFTAEYRYSDWSSE